MTTTLGSSTQTKTMDDAVGIEDTFYILTDNQSKQWTADKVFTESTTGEKRKIDIATDASGNTVAVWEDSRNSDSYNDSFSSTNGLVEARRRHTSTLLNDGKVLVTGGIDSNTISTAELYDPATTTFTLTSGNMVDDRRTHSSTLLNDGRVFIAGGYRTPGSYALSSAEIYDPSTDTFSILTTYMSDSESSPRATLLNNGRVLILISSIADVFDPATESFTVTANNMSIDRASPSTTLLNDGTVLIAAGSSTASLAEIYNPATNSFSGVGYTNEVRTSHEAVLLDNGRALIAGGDDNHSSAEIYDPATRTFSVTGYMEYLRIDFQSILLNNGKVLVVSGNGGGTERWSSAELYDPEGGTFTLTGFSSIRRYQFSANLLNNGKVLFIGGYIGTTTSEVEIFTPRTYDVYAQKYDLSGAEQWDGDSGEGGNQDVKVNSDDGNRDSNSVSNYDHINPKVKLDSSGNAVVVWQESRNSVYGDDIYGQKLQAADGAKLWPAATTDSFAVADYMTARRGFHTYTLLEDGKVLITGGFDSAAFLSSAEIFDEVADSFTAAGNMAESRYLHRAALMNNGRVLVVGGFNGSSYLSSAEIYDVTNDSFSAADYMEYLRGVPTVTLLANGKILVTGGSRTDSSFLSNTELYDPENDTFSTTDSMEFMRGRHTATLLNNHKVLIVGGMDFQGGNNFQSSAELYDPVADAFTAADSMSEQRANHRATLLNSGKVLITGGDDSGSAKSSSEVYDPASDTFTTTASYMAERRTDHSAILLNNGKVLVAGGYTGGSTFFSSSEIYDPASDTFTAADYMAERRAVHGGNLLMSGKVLVSGGAASAYLSHTEIYTPASDIAVSNDGSPTNGYGLPRPEYPNNGKGILGEQRKPVLGIDSSDNVIVAWEDGRFDAIQNWGLSFDYDSNAWWQTNRNLGATGVCNSGEGWQNSCGAMQAIKGRPLRILGQKLSSGDGGKNWGDDLDAENKNNPQDIILSATGDVNRNPDIAIDGTDVILTWDSNSAVKTENGNMKREGNIYAQKFNSSGQSQWGGDWTNTQTMIQSRDTHTATLLGNGKVLIAGGTTNGTTGTRTSRAEIYDPSTGTWSETPSMYVSRMSASSTLMSDGRLLIAGGRGTISQSNSEIFDPANNSWSEIDSMSAGKWRHTGTLLGDGRIIEIGGGNTVAEIFDPTTEAWSVAPGLNQSRSMNTATLLHDGRVLVVGGNSGGELTDVELFNPTTEAWSVATGLNEARFWHSSALLKDGRVLVAGGESGSNVLSSVELYNPLTDSWTYLASLNQIRSLHGSVVLANGKVIVAGGCTDSDCTGKTTHAEIYDPLANTWSVTAGISSAIDLFSMTQLASGKVLLAGGQNGNTTSIAEIYSIDQMVNSGVDLAEQSNPVATYSASTSEIFFAWQGMRGSDSGGGRSHTGGSSRGGLQWNIYGQKTNNPSSGNLTNQWPDGSSDIFSTTTGILIGNREEHAATLLNSGRVLITGGNDGSFLTTVELFDPSSDTFTNTAAGLNRARNNHSATLLNNNQVLITGGTYNYSTGELYDPYAQTFSETGVMNWLRKDHSAVLLRDGKVLITGGREASSTYSSTAEVYDPLTGTFSTISDNLSGLRAYHTSTLLPNGKVMIMGGYNDSAYLSTMEIFDPINETFTSGTSSVYQHGWPSSALLNSGKVLVVGGILSSNAEIYDPGNDTWSTSTNMMSSIRAQHSAALLSNGKVLVTGGYNGSIMMSLAEIYDPSTRTFILTDYMPFMRRYHTLTLLIDGRVLVAGGQESGSNYNSAAELYNPSGEAMVSHDFGMAGDQINPSIVMSDGPDPIVAWQDNRSFLGNTVTTDWNVFMQKIDNTTGEPLWPARRTVNGSFSSPFTVMDIRADSYAGGTGTHYTGKPAIGGVDSNQDMFITWESNLDDSNAAAGECGYSNTSDQVRVCGQRFAIDEQNIEQDEDWNLYFYAYLNSGTPQLTVNADIAEWDGVQIVEESNDRAWTYSGDGQQSFNFDTGGSNPPPSDLVGNVTMRRYMAKFTWVADSVDIEYDNTGRDSRLEAGGQAGVQDDIDDVPTSELSDGLSTVGDSSGQVHLLFVDEDTTDQISYKRRTSGGTWDSTGAMVSDAANDNHAYPTLTIDTTANDLHALWIDTSAGGDVTAIYYTKCDVTTNCESEGEWDPETKWKTGDTFTNITTNYSGPGYVHAAWTVGDAAPYHVSWSYVIIPEKLFLFIGVAPLIPLLLKRRKDKRAYVQVQRK